MAGYENPLVPSARLRQIYLAMLRARLLEKALPAARRGRALAGGSKGRATGYAVGTLGLEAGLAGTSVDLGPGDLVSDALSGGVVDFLRGAALAAAFAASPRPGEASTRRAAKGTKADCGAAGRLPGGPGVAERLWAAMGAAAGLRCAAAVAKIIAQAEGATAKQAGVAVVYVRAGEAPPALWRKLLGFAAERELPVVFVVLRPVRRGGAQAGGLSALALKCGVPGIAVDADDAVAIYRVAQESIGRARMGGGAALIECVPFVLSGALGTRGDALGTRRGAEDAIGGLEHYMAQRSLCTRAWMERAARGFTERLATERQRVR
jgi:TPP-dependent pyruvate/acetoin dehydrogenase alpha subunit